jgi:hypothetical protein
MRINYMFSKTLIDAFKIDDILMNINLIADRQYRMKRNEIK